MSYSSKLRIVCETEAMIVVPPGDPTVMTGSPSLKMIVGVILDNGRLFGWTSFAPPGRASKSVSSLFKKNPYSGTRIPVPNNCSMVVVNDTTFPH